MKDDSLLTSRTAWTAILTVATTQTDQFRGLPPTMQWGIFMVASAYILARGLQKGLTSSKP